MDTKTLNTPMLQEVSQFEVDFVIPRWGIDLPIGIDPFLLFKSRDPILADLHDKILTVFNTGVSFIRDNQLDKARDVFLFPEVSEIGMGYTKKGKRGSGVGTYLTELIVQTLMDAPLLVERGIKHIEEMQLVSVGIGPDRISDIAANILKQYLIEYTQKQCLLWNIPLVTGVPVNHVFNFETLTWYDGYFDLPISRIDNAGMLFVPRRIVRSLPWINYNDFFRMEFSSYLRAKRAKAGVKSTATPKPITKMEAISITRAEIERIDRYIEAKEHAASEAQPSFSYIDTGGICLESERLKATLATIQPGTADATLFQRTTLEILNFLFNPELIDGALEVATVDGTERRDIIFTNDSDKTFWSYLRNDHSSIFLMFEIKNTRSIENIYLNQVATYLGSRLGYVGFIVTRDKVAASQQRKVYSIYNDSHPKKIILVISDEDMQIMLDMKCQGNDPMRHIQKLYRDFRTGVQ